MVKKAASYTDKNTPYIYKDFGYNLQDPEFWDKSLMWQRGATVEGCYNFQLYGLKKEWITPPIDYPQEILDLYSE